MSPHGQSLILDQSNLGDYLALHPDLQQRVGSIETVESPVDGNINGVFIVRGDRGSLFLKQGLPWVRIIESWELTPERTAREANFFRRWEPYADGLLPEVFGFDPENHILAMEDLSTFRILTNVLESDDQVANVERIGRLVARGFIATSPFFVGPVEFSERLREAENAELALLMEQVVFDQPWNTEPLEHCYPDLREMVNDLLLDRDFMRRIGELKYIFRTSHEGLIHGDLHTGSVMVKGSEVRVFDAEFARYGPVAWDIGEFIGHLLIARTVFDLSPGKTGPRDAVARLPGRLWAAFAEAVGDEWPRRQDWIFGEGFFESWLAGQRQLSARFAGAEIARRVTGIGKASLVEAMPEAQMLAASSALLGEARELIVSGEPSWN